MAEKLREILNGLATAYRKYPLKQIEETKEVDQAITEIKSLIKGKLPEKIKAEIEINTYKQKYIVGTTYNPYAWTDKSLPFRKGCNQALTKIEKIVEEL